MASSKTGRGEVVTEVVTDGGAATTPRKRKAECSVSSPAEAYSSAYFVKSWVHKWGYVPLQKVELIQIDEGEIETGRRCTEDEALPIGMKKMWRVHVDEGKEKGKEKEKEKEKGRGRGKRRMIGEKEVEVEKEKEKEEKEKKVVDEWTPYLVDYGDYHRVTCSPDAYVESLSDNLDKKKRNVDFLTLLVNNHRADRNVVYLDAPSCQTTKLLHGIDMFKSSQLHVPNPDKSFLERAPAHFKTMATHYNATIYEWMRDVNDYEGDEYDFGLDYCCTFVGNNTIKPKEDLTFMFRNRMLAKHNGILWLTFSSRGCGVESTREEVVKFVVTMAEANGYQIEWVNKDLFTYGHGMTYFFFRTK
jgi:hypothetical protein